MKKEYFYILLTVATLVFIVYSVRQTPEERYEHQLEQVYAEDVYGGSTPEETISGFVVALRKGDDLLASKYFVADKQASWLADIQNIRSKGLIVNMIEDVSSMQKTASTSDIVLYSIKASDGGALTVMLGKAQNGKWKIVEL